MTTEPELLGARNPEYQPILNPRALAFVADLCRRFSPRIDRLLASRNARQARLDAGELFTFLPETQAIRDSEWRVAPTPDDLRDRRVELTAPPERKLVINALNSGANCFMADFEDATAPVWDNLIRGQVNLRDAVNGTIHHEDAGAGKRYTLGDHPAVLLVRPRGLHLREAHVRLDGRPIPAALFDFGLYFFHNAHTLLQQGSGPYFYLPKLESHLEARLWNDIFIHAQRALDLPPGSIRATVLIETLPAAFEMDEILYELRDHVCGLNCGRWDYIFSFIKKLRAHSASVLPDRGQVTMTQPFMRAYTQLLVKTCHRRGAHAMGGMAAQLPIADDPAANKIAFDKVRADKLREVRDGHDGTWVAHPDLVPVARAVFDQHMSGPNQIAWQRADLCITPEELLRTPDGTRTEAGLHNNIRVALHYIAAWLNGRGAVPIDRMMEDMATAEIARSQCWSWLQHGASVEGIGPLTEKRFLQAVEHQVRQIRQKVGEAGFAEGGYDRATALFRELCLNPEYAEFLTEHSYPALVPISSAE